MKKLVVGLDFDGVLAYNPARIIRAPVKWFKRRVLKIRKLTFFVPKNSWQRFWWTLVHESSIWPAQGAEELVEMIKEGKIEAHLVTARYSFLRENLDQWLEKHNLRKVFKSINANEDNEQPHLFKERVIKKYKFDYFIEDNWDIVEYLTPRVKTRVFWIYNILDSRKKYPNKFPYLQKALGALADK